jgi:hypothetical protein
MVGYDLNVFNVKGSDLLCRVTDLEISVSRDFIDVSGITDSPFGVYRPGAGDFEVTGTVLLVSSPQFYNDLIAGTEVYVQIAWDATPGADDNYGFNFYAYIGTNDISFSGRGDAVTESVTLRPSRGTCGGGTPISVVPGA